MPSSGQVAFLARQTLTVNWVPPALGDYAISVEVAPVPNNLLLMKDKTTEKYLPKYIVIGQAK